MLVLGIIYTIDALKEQGLSQENINLLFFQNRVLYLQISLV